VTTFYLIRHAEREGDQQRLVGRAEGVRLSARGRRQAARVAERLAHDSLNHVFSSPMERAQETAEPLARAHGVSVEISHAVTEIDFGGWTGRTFPELAADDEWRKFNAFCSVTCPPNGEGMPAVQARVVGEILRLRKILPDSRVAVVSHGDPIRVAIAYFLGAPLDLFERIEIRLASVSVLTMDEAGARLLRLNETANERDEAQ
jgi:probable phosphoglycerate mutase